MPSPQRPLRSAAAVAALFLATPALAQQGDWQSMPRMQLDGQYAGPLYDTIVQRWRDPDTGTLCYLYLPITVAHTPPPQQGYVKYGPNTIGSISCVPGVAKARGDRVPKPQPKPKKK
jgi:hypothetical protein